jgi:hypothetical protein
MQPSAKKGYKIALISYSTPNSVLIADSEGKLCQYFIIDKAASRIIPWTCWKQNRICKKTLHKPHLTCLNCRIRKYVNNEIPQTLQVVPYILLVQTNRKKWKKAICKKLLSIIEFLR